MSDRDNAIQRLLIALLGGYGPFNERQDERLVGQFYDAAYQRGLREAIAMCEAVKHSERAGLDPDYPAACDDIREALTRLVDGTHA